MNNVEYDVTQSKIISFYERLSLANLDLDSFLERIRMAESAAPILDPTLWIKASGSLAQIKKMAEALKPAINLIKEFRQNG